MSMSTTPTFVVKYWDQLGQHKVIWSPRVRGQRPKEGSAEEWRQTMNQSLKSGGCNYHLSESHGFLVHVHRVQIWNQIKNIMVEEAKMPMFEQV